MFQSARKNETDLEKSYQLACRCESNVLITGQTGTGKTTVARQIHEQGSRRHSPFVVVNLATLHDGTLESELFGHEKGAFTGATSFRKGQLEAAHGGTVFLDEVGELPVRLQARLLEFLQSKTISRVGANRVHKIDVRIIAATQVDLKNAIARGKFREDLYHRLNVIQLHLPSLGERSEAFGELVHRLIESISQAQHKPISKVSREVAERLEQYNWPGNIRELRNVLEYAVSGCFGETIELVHLPTWFLEACHELGEQIDQSEESGILAQISVPLTYNYRETLARFERLYLQMALKRYGGRMNLTARNIGLSKSTFIRRVHSFDIKPKIH